MTERARRPYEAWAVVMEDGRIWPHAEDYYGSGPEAQRLELVLVDRTELMRRFPRLAVALEASNNRDTPFVVREP
jgi:hypothetical protein